MVGHLQCTFCTSSFAAKGLGYPHNPRRVQRPFALVRLAFILSQLPALFLARTLQIVTYVTNHHASLGAWKEIEGTMALLKPGDTRFGTNYIMIERVVHVWDKLDLLVATDAWKEMVRKLPAGDRPKAEKIKGLVRSTELEERLRKVRAGVGPRAWQSSVCAATSW